MPAKAERSFEARMQEYRFPRYPMREVYEYLMQGKLRDL